MTRLPTFASLLLIQISLFARLAYAIQGADGLLLLHLSFLLLGSMMIGAPVDELMSEEHLLGLLLDVMRLILVAPKSLGHPLLLLAHQ